MFLFGLFVILLIIVMVCGFCVLIYFMIVGGVIRMSVKWLENNKLLLYLLKINKYESLVNVIFILVSIYCFMLILVSLNILIIGSLVLCVNVFFLVNVIIGLCVGFKLLKSIKFRILIVIFVILFLLFILRVDIWS